MSVETMKRAVDLAIHEALKQYDRTLHIYFIGGEPLLAFDTIKKCNFYAREQCRKHNLKLVYSTTTNGTLLNQEITDFFIKNDFDLKLSLDGTAIVHDENRKYYDGTGSYKRISDNLHFIRTIEEATGRHVHAAQVISANTCRELKHSLEHLYDLGFSIVESSINLYEDWTKENLDVLFSVIRESFLFYKDLKEKGESFHWKFVEARLRLFSEKSDCLYACKAGISSCLVTVDGAIYPCTEVDDAVRIGDVINGLDVRKIREFVNIKTTENKECLKCEEYEHCPACQCIMLNYDIYGDFYKPSDAECELTKYMFHLFRTELSQKQQEAFSIYYKEKKIC